MKKWYRIGICLALIVCLLLLTACQSGPNAPVSDPTLTTDKTGETAGTQAPENFSKTNDDETNTLQEDVKSNPPKTLYFNWNNSFFHLMGSLLLNDVASAKQVTYEELKDLMNAHSLLYDSLHPEGEYQQALVKAIYPEEFYENNSLILIPVCTQNAALEITDVHYADGVLKCSVKTWLRPEDETKWWDSNHNWLFYCFVEIDTVLPEGTQIVCDVTEERISSAEYRTKLDNFRDKCLYYNANYA